MFFFAKKYLSLSKNKSIETTNFIPKNTNFTLFSKQLKNKKFNVFFSFPLSSSIAFPSPSPSPQNKFKYTLFLFFSSFLFFFFANLTSKIQNLNFSKTQIKKNYKTSKKTKNLLSNTKQPDPTNSPYSILGTTKYKQKNMTNTTRTPQNLEKERRTKFPRQRNTSTIDTRNIPAFFLATIRDNKLKIFTPQEIQKENYSYNKNLTNMSDNPKQLTNLSKSRP